MIRSKLSRNACLLAVLTMVFSLRLVAQGGGNAAITGRVLDPSGAVVVGAQVTVTQQATSLKRSATTNASGDFTIPSLPPASYSVTIEAPGFKSLKQDITLLADQIRAIDARLELGQANQQ